MPLLPRRLALLSPLLWPWRADAEGLTLEALMSAIAKPGERRAIFRETRHFAALEGALESRGHLLYRPGYLEKVTEWPIPERLEVAGDRVVLTSGNDPPRVVDLGTVPALRVLIDAIRAPLAGDSEALRHAFTVTLTGAEAAWALDLAPTGTAAEKLLRSVRLEGHAGQIGRITLIQANGDDQVMVIEPP